MITLGIETSCDDPVVELEKSFTTGREVVTLIFIK